MVNEDEISRADAPRTVKKAKKQRTQAKRMHTELMKSISNAIAERKSTSEVKMLRQELASSFEKCESAHHRYNELSGTTDEAWLKEIECLTKKRYEELDRYLQQQPKTASSSSRLSKSKIVYEKARLVAEYIKEKLEDEENLLKIKIKKRELEHQSKMRAWDNHSKYSDSDESSIASGSHRSSTHRSKDPHQTLWIDNIHHENPSAEHVPKMYGWSSTVIPKTSITPFGGDPRAFPMFLSQFKTLVHDIVPGDGQRLAILRELLTPEVRVRFADTLDSPDLYQTVLKDLQRRYGQPHLIARCYIRDLLELVNCNSSDHESLRKFSDKLHGIVTSLNRGGYVHDLKSATTLEQVLAKLPVYVRSRWATFARKRQPREVDLIDLNKFLGDIIEEQQFVLPLLTSKKDSASKGAAAKTGKSRSSPSSYATTANSSPTCSCCSNDDHLISTCARFTKMSPTERAEVIKSQGRCFRCLEMGHRSATCRSKSRCGVDGCSAKHHPKLHGAERVYPARSLQETTEHASENREPTAATEDGTSINTTSTVATSSVLLAIVPVRLRAGQVTVDTFTLLDNGSEATLVRKDIADLLGLQGEPRRVTFGTFKGKDAEEETRLVDFSISAIDDSATFNIVDAYVVPRLKISNRCSKLEESVRQLDYLAKIEFPRVPVGSVTVLLGMDVQDAHIVKEVRRPPPGQAGPNAVLTPFGWCPVGKLSGVNRRRARAINFTSLADSDLQEMVNRFWNTESFGVVPGKCKLVSEVDARAINILKNIISLVGDRYEVGLMWKHPDVVLPQNRSAALRRLYAVERRFRADGSFAERYRAVIEDHIRQGHAVKIDAKEDQTSRRVWYLPHHAVVNPNKPGKLRVVFDASAKHHGVSLNDKLLKGPDLLTSLVGVLLRFREYAVAVSGDIEKMFYQVKVRSEDRPALRFVWRNPASSSPPEEFEMTVQVFGAVSSPTTCTFALRQTVKDNEVGHQDIAAKVIENFYVDNYLDSFRPVEEAVKTSEKMIRLLAKGGFRLNQWLSSSREVLRTLPASELNSPDLNIDLDDLPVERTLGQYWDCEEDTFCFKFQVSQAADSKRKILAAVSSIFDPLGLLAPVILVPKILLQDIWTLNADWDEPLPNNILARWRKWTNNLAKLAELQIPRCLFGNTTSSSPRVQLHLFSDASEAGFGAVAYLLIRREMKVTVSFVIAKSRVAPIRPLTIPKLELPGAVIASRLARMVKEELRIDIEEVIFWVDSQTVLQWIHSTSFRFQTFVANRISEILDSTNAAQWRHVPGVLNPADDCSRGLLPEELSAEHRWFRGPEFLYQPEEQWPAPYQPVLPSDTEEQLIGHVKHESTVDKGSDLFYRYSNLSRLVRIVAWIQRFRPRSLMSQHIDEKTVLAAEELKLSLNICIRAAQRQMFPQELALLEKSKPIQVTSSLLKLNPYLDQEKIVRVGGRLQNSSLPFEAKHPIILCHRHPITALIIRETHLDLYHAQTERTLCELRGRYWVLRGRDTVRKFIRKCVTCQRFRVQPRQPMMSSLPPQRVQVQPPFSCVAVDYFGPF